MSPVSGVFLALLIAANPSSVVVQPGETLWRIAARELGDGQKWRDLAAWNGLAEPYTIEAGQELVLRAPASDAGTVRPADHSAEMTPPSGNPRGFRGAPSPGTFPGGSRGGRFRDGSESRGWDRSRGRGMGRWNETATAAHAARSAPIVEEPVEAPEPVKPATLPTRSPSAPLPETPRTVPITLAEALTSALGSNITLRSGRLNPESARSDVEAARASFDPNLSASAQESFDRSRSATTNLATDRRTTSLSTGVSQTLPTGTGYDVSLSTSASRTTTTSTFSASHSTEATLTVTQPLLEGFGRGVAYAGVESAREALAASTRRATRLEATTASDIEAAYWSLAAAEAAEETSRRSLATAEDLLARNEGKLEHQLIAEVEVLTARAGVASRRASVVSAMTSRQKAAEELLFKIHGEAASGLGYLPVTTTAPAPAALPRPVAELEAAALSSRDDLAAARNDLRSAEITLGVRKNALLPDLGFTGSVGTGSSASRFTPSWEGVLENDEPSWSAGLVLTVPLGNRSDRARARAAEISLEKSRLSVAALENDIRLEVRNARRDVVLGLEQLAAAEESRRLSDATLEAEKARHELGLGDTLRLLQSEEDASQARLSEVKARYNLASALARLRAATGETMLTTETGAGR